MSYARVPDQDLIDQDEPLVAPPQYQEPTPQVIHPQVPVDTNSNVFKLNFYRQYFDLDSEIFFAKIQKAINPLLSSFGVESDEAESPELYGFIWITGTLIFLMFVSTTGSNILSHWLHSTDGNYEYNFDLLTFSVTLFYGYNFLVPMVLYIVTSHFLKFPNRLLLTKTMSIYGYTNLLWIPITLANFVIVIFINNDKHHVLLNLLEWLVVLASGVVTGMSNISKIFPSVKKNCLLLHNGDIDASNRQTYIILGALAVAHVAFTLAVKVCFFGIF